MASMDEEQIKNMPQYLDLDQSANLEKPLDLPVEGTVPKWLKGSLYRNGSGVYKMGDTWWNHAFDGFSVLHRWTIQDGKVSYLSTILDSDHYKKCVKHNRIVGANFGSNFPDPCKSIFSRFFSYFLPQPPAKNDNTAVNLVAHGDRLFALTETTTINEIKPDTMLRKQRIEMADILALHMGTAHPHSEKDGTIYYYGTNMKHDTAYNFIRIPPPQKDAENPFAAAELIGVVPSRWKMNMGYTHSFGMTENYFVHFEQPLAINLPRILTMTMRKNSIADCMITYPGEPIDIHIVNKKTGERIPIKFKAPHGFVFHFINCFEENGQIVCDVSLYTECQIVKDLYLKSILAQESKELSFSYFSRFVLPLNIDKAEEGKNLVTLPGTKATAVLRKGTKNVVDVKCDKMFDEVMELPRINYDFNAKKYRYAYGSTVFLKNTRRVMKFDAEGKTMTEWTCDDNHVPGEPVFVPTPGGTKEDDGVVLVPILAETTEHSSFLLVLDAASFKEVARATVPSHVKMNLTFHGLFADKVF